MRKRRRRRRRTTTTTTTTEGEMDDQLLKIIIYRLTYPKIIISTSIFIVLFTLS
jgi:hypothetical protein